MPPLPFFARPFARPIPLASVLAFATAIPVVMAMVTAVQIPMGALPDDSLRLMVAPAALFAHALSGAAFGLAGPVQFILALRGRFGIAHRITGRIFVLAGLGLGASGLALFAQISSTATPVLDSARSLAGAALIAALVLGLRAIHARKLARHRAWMIRAYAIGMGSGTVALVYLPIYVITGTPPTGLTSDLILVGWWGFNVALAEILIRHLESRR